MNFTATDGWGYRNRSSSSDNKVRFVCPNEGVAPTQWKRSTLQEWEEKVVWAGEATDTAFSGRTTTPATRYSGA